MWGAPSLHIACCKLTQRIIPSCVNSDGPGTATETWSASTAKASTTSLHFKKATNLALVLNFTETEGLLKLNETYLQRHPDLYKHKKLTALTAERWAVEQLVCPGCWAGSSQLCLKCCRLLQHPSDALSRQPAQMPGHQLCIRLQHIPFVFTCLSSQLQKLK